MKRLTALAASGAVLLAGCTAPTTAPRTTLVVFAAASLTQAFGDLGASFRATHPTTDVTFSFLGSSELVAHLQGGAPADVLAAADERTMKAATDAHLMAGAPTIFATNTLVLIAPAGNPAKVTGLDGSLTGTKLVVCAPAVPCGAATRQLAQRVGVTLAPVSEEQKVTDVRGKVESGQADAGLVYATDAKAAGDKVTTIRIPGAENVVNRYPLGVTAASKQAAPAQAFVDHVTSPAGRDVLARYGFGAP